MQSLHADLMQSTGRVLGIGRFSLRISAFFVAFFVLSGCSPPARYASPTLTAEITPTITPTPLPLRTATPSPQTSLTPTEIKYRLTDELGTVFFCDPDLYPVARVIDEREFERRFSEIERNSQVFQAILKKRSFPATNLSAEQKRAVYADYKMLNAILLQPVGDHYQFSLRVIDAQKGAFAVEGSVGRVGDITITKKEPANTNCPICLSGETRIDTPEGPIPVKELRVGMRVWTADLSGDRQEATVLETVARPVAIGVSLVHIVLDDGRELFASPGHPAADGRPIGVFQVGDRLDGGRVAVMELLEYGEGATYDILPSGATGSYWANGILLKSTLHR